MKPYQYRLIDVMAATDTRVSPDWVFSNNSNVSVAKDREWFASYTPFTSYIGNILSSDSRQAVAGIGSVEVPVKLPYSRNGKKHGIIRIDEVLHVPTGICNILGGGSFMDQYPVFGGGSIRDCEGRIAGCFDKNKTLLCLKLSGPPVGPVTTRSLFLKSDNSHTFHYINAYWDNSERMVLAVTTRLKLLTIAT